MAQSGQKFATGLNNLGGSDALGSSNNFPLIIKTFGTEQMRITPSGNVGIGIANPSDKLHVAGTARMTDATIDNQLQSLNIIAQTANFATAVVTGNFSAGSLTVNGNATINGSLSVVSGQLSVGSNLSMDGNNSTITSSSGNISFGNNNLSTTGNVNSANISALQSADSIFSSQISLLTTHDSIHNSQLSILNSQFSSITSSQWTTTQNGIEHNGNVFVKNLSVEESINIGSFRFSNGSKDTAIAPPPVIKDTIASDKPMVISAEKNISLSADTVLLGNGTGKVVIGPPLPSPSNEKLSVVGDVGVSGNLRLSNLSGTDERLLYVDSSGNLKVNPLTTGDAWVTDGNEISNGDFIGTTNSNDLVIKTNNLERMHITATGKVGIGTSNPQKRLHIWQTDDVNNPDCGTVLRLEYNVPNSPNGCQQSGSSLWDFKAKLDGNSNGLLTLNNASTSQVVLSFLHNGNVGIGTTTPIQMLDVNGKMNLSGGVIQQGGLPITSTSDLGLYSLNGLHMRFVTNNAPFRFFSDGGTTPEGNKELISIESSGNLRMNEHDVLFRSSFPDGNHGIGWYGVDPNFPPAKLFAQTNVNGPVVYGYDGGALGIKQGNTENVVLRWNSSSVGISAPYIPTDPVSGQLFKLAVGGKVLATEYVVRLLQDWWPDYKFTEKLLPWEDFQNEVNNLGHFPGLPSAKEVHKNKTFSLGDVQIGHLAITELLYRYLGETKTKMAQLEKDKEQLKQQNENLELRIEKLEKKLSEK